MALRVMKPCGVEFPHRTHEYDNGGVVHATCGGVRLQLWQLVPIERIEEGYFANLAAFPAIREGEQEWAPENSVTTQSLVAVECPICWSLVRDEKFTEHVTGVHGDDVPHDDISDILGYHELLMGRVQELSEPTEENGESGS